MRPMTASRRRRAESLMTGRCVIRRPTGNRITDPETLRVVDEYEVVYGPGTPKWQGRCKGQTFRPQESTPNAGEATAVEVNSEVHIPVGSVAVEPGDIVTIIRSTDHLLAGRSYRVRADEPTVEHASAYKVPVSRIVGEEVPPWPASP